MTGFIVRRLLSSLLVVILTSMFVFVLFFKGLGDSPARNYCEKLGHGTCRAATLDSIKQQMGLDKPLVYNYTQWAKGIFVGRKNVYQDGKLYDCPAPCLGISITTGNPVWTDLKQKYPATLILAVGGATIYLTLGVFLGAHGRPMAGHLGRPTTGGRDPARLVDPVLRDRAAGVDLPVPAATDTSRTPGTTRSPRIQPRPSAT